MPDESPKAFADRFMEDADRAGRTEDEALVFQFLRQMQPDLHHGLLLLLLPHLLQVLMNWPGDLSAW